MVAVADGLIGSLNMRPLDGFELGYVMRSAFPENHWLEKNTTNRWIGFLWYVETHGMSMSPVGLHLIIELT